MSTELRVQNQSQQLYVRALSAAWRNRTQLFDPSLWLIRDPDAEEKMLRDADIAHAVGFRRHLIAGKRWSMQAKDKADPRGEMAVAVGTGLVGQIQHFSQARLQLARAFFSGSRFARIIGSERTMTIGDGKPRVWWVPDRLDDEDKRMYRIVPQRDVYDDNLRATWEHWNVAKSAWEPLSQWEAIHTVRHVYQDDQATLGHGRSLRDALGWWWYAKENVFAESLQAVERFAQGIMTAKIDGARDAATGLPNDEVIAAWSDVLENLRARHVLVYDSSDQIEMVPQQSSGWEMMSGLRAELRSTIFTLVLGANLTTAANDGGSYALAEIQENSTEALIQFDRQTMEDTLSDDLVGCIWYRNHANMVELGIADARPRFSIVQEKKLDPLVRAQVAQALHGMGVALSRDELMEQTGFTPPKDGEEIIAGATEPPPQPAGAGMLGLPPLGASA